MSQINLAGSSQMRNLLGGACIGESVEENVDENVELDSTRNVVLQNVVNDQVDEVNDQVDVVNDQVDEVND